MAGAELIGAFGPDPGSVVRTWASPALSPVALVREKRWFREGNGAVPYVRRCGLRVALGEPLGDPRARARVLEAFLAEARGAGEEVAFLPVGESARGEFVARGYASVRVGREAILDLEGFHLRGAPRKTVRQSGNRLRRLGHRFELLDPPHSGALLAELAAVSEAWLRTRRGFELGFGTGRFDSRELAASPMGVIRDPAGRITAFLTLFLPGDGAAAGIDLMRHDPRAPSGTMDHLFAATALALRDRGLERLHLGLAPLAGVTFGSARGPEEIILAVVRRLAPGYSFRGLEAFKEKFRPRWEERYLVCSARRMLLPALVAACDLDGPRLAARGLAGIRAALGSAPASRPTSHGVPPREGTRKETPCWSIVSTRI